MYSPRFYSKKYLQNTLKTPVQVRAKLKFGIVSNSYTAYKLIICLLIIPFFASDYFAKHTQLYNMFKILTVFMV